LSSGGNEGVFGGKEISLIENILKFKLKLDKSNIDKLIQVTFKRMISSTTKVVDFRFLRKFLCLIELIESILMASSYATSFYLDKLTSDEVRDLFRIVHVYLNCLMTTRRSTDEEKEVEEDEAENDELNDNEKFLIYRNKTLLTIDIVDRDNVGRKCGRINLKFQKLWLNVNMIILR
jgi:hypothetical protein